MPKIQTLGLSDAGWKRPSEPSSPPEPPGAPAPQDSPKPEVDPGLHPQIAAAPPPTAPPDSHIQPENEAAPARDEPPRFPPGSHQVSIGAALTPATPPSKPVGFPDAVTPVEEFGQNIQDTPLQTAAHEQGDPIPEWDALVDALTTSDPVHRPASGSLPWVAPKSKPGAAPDWDAIGEAIDKLGPGAPANPDSASGPEAAIGSAVGIGPRAPQIFSPQSATADVGELSIHAEDKAPSEPHPVVAPPHARTGLGGWVAYVILVLLAVGAGIVGGLVFVHSADLPQIRQLMDYRPDVMTELYADDGTAVGSFALEHRIIVTYDDIPKVLKDAVLSVEDRHFESHWGVDVVRVAGASVRNLTEWRWAQGASTLTMQLSKVLFLTPERKFKRKFQEVLIAIQIERHFTKPQIFTLYANQVDLGHGNFGFAAAAQFYFGKRLDQLTLPEAALLAGLPQTPSGNSPLLNPDRARQRRNQVLAMMLDNGKITEAEFREARSTPLALNVQRWTKGVAPYFIEDARQFLEKKYGAEAVHEEGLRVYATINLRAQELAERALRNGLHTYDKRHGWRGPVTNIIKNPPTLPNGLIATPETYRHPDWRNPLEPGRLVHGVVMEVKPDHAIVRIGEQTARVVAADIAWTGKKIDQVFVPGDVDLFLIKEPKEDSLRVTLDQRPLAQGAVVVIENSTGAVRAMVGGYDFEESKFNRARQATRQAGSSFKPYVYAAALAEGARPFDLIMDEPVSFSTASGAWAPRNYDGKFLGNITLLHALAESRNIPAVKLAERVGVNKIIAMCRKFGLTARLAPVLPLALGASDLTLLEHTSAFSTFPNDGVHISPRMIARVTNYDGQVVDEFPPDVTDVVSAPIARLEVSMLREVFLSGTAARARQLAEKFPMAGKTGTTNDFMDASFVGFTPAMTCGVWVGFDDRRTLGPREDGARVALPIWTEFMTEWLKDQKSEDFAHSPRLTKPEQVEEILASAGTDRILAQGNGEDSPAGAAGAERSSASQVGSSTPAGAAAAPGTQPKIPPVQGTQPVGAAPAPAGAVQSSASGERAITPAAPTAPAAGPASAPPKQAAPAPAPKESTAPPAAKASAVPPK